MPNEEEYAWWMTKETSVRNIFIAAMSFPKDVQPDLNARRLRWKP